MAIKSHVLHGIDDKDAAARNSVGKLTEIAIGRIGRWLMVKRLFTMLIQTKHMSTVTNPTAAFLI